MAVERGALVIGHISGYTGYLTGMELEHPRDVMADLLDTMCDGNNIGAGMETIERLAAA